MVWKRDRSWWDQVIAWLYCNDDLHEVAGGGVITSPRDVIFSGVLRRYHPLWLNSMTSEAHLAFQRPKNKRYPDIIRDERLCDPFHSSWHIIARTSTCICKGRLRAGSIILLDVQVMGLPKLYTASGWRNTESKTTQASPPLDTRTVWQWSRYHEDIIERQSSCLE